MLRQVVFALAVAEQELEFEHRDLHIGNVLVKNCEDETITFLLDGGIFSFPTEGIVATVIDFTISRLKKGVFFNYKTSCDMCWLCIRDVLCFSFVGYKGEKYL